MAAKRKKQAKKAAPKKTIERKLRTSLQPVQIKNQLKQGGRERVVWCYFSQIYFVERNRQSWGNYVSYYEGSNFALNPEELFQLGENIAVEPGAEFCISSEMVLVVLGQTHSLVVSFDEFDEFDESKLKRLSYMRTLTLGAVCKILANVGSSNSHRVFITKNSPSPIAFRDQRNWSLVVGSDDRRAWMITEFNFPKEIHVDDDFLKLHVYFNSPHNAWKFS